MPKVDLSKYSPDTVQNKSRDILVDMSTPDKSVSLYFGRGSNEKKPKEAPKKKTTLKKPGTKQESPYSIHKTVTKAQQKRNKTVTTKYSFKKHGEAKDRLNRNKTVTKAQQNRNPDRNKTVTSSIEQNNFPQTDPLNRNKTVTERVTKAQQNRNKTVTESVTNKGVDIGYLHGNELSIMTYLFTLCSSIGDRITPLLSYEKIRLETELKSSEVVRMSIYRLIEKSMLIKNAFKNGKGGWVKFEIPKDIYRDLSLLNRNKTVTKAQQNRNPDRNKSVTESVTSLPNNNIYKDNNIITNTDNEYLPPQSDRLPFMDQSDWELVWQKVAQYEIFGITRNKFEEIRNNTSLMPYQVEASLLTFFQDYLKNPGKLRASFRLKEDETPITLFSMIVAILSKGKEYKPIYTNPKDAVYGELDKNINHYLNLLDVKEGEEQKRSDKLFQIWLEETSKDEIFELINIPINQRAGLKEKSGPVQDKLWKEEAKTYFLENKLEDYIKKFSEPVTTESALQDQTRKESISEH